MPITRTNPVQPELERGILEAALSGDQAGFSALYRLYSPRVYAYTLKRVGDWSVAEDLSQEVFFHVHRSLKSFRGDSSLASWIFGIAHNVVSHHYHARARARRIESSCTDPMQDGIRFGAGTERGIDAARALRRCGAVLSISQQPVNQRIFDLRYHECASVHEIAKRVGKSNDAVKASLRRSRCTLLDRIPELGEVLNTPTRVAS